MAAEVGVVAPHGMDTGTLTTTTITIPYRSLLTTDFRTFLGCASASASALEAALYRLRKANIGVWRVRFAFGIGFGLALRLELHCIADRRWILELELEIGVSCIILDGDNVIEINLF